MLLTADNVLNYLTELNLCRSADREEIQIKPLIAKNFNLLVTFPDSHKILVKQERRDRDGKTANEFRLEWRIQESLKEFRELEALASFFPEVLHFDEENSIIVFQFLDQYSD